MMNNRSMRRVVACHPARDCTSNLLDDLVFACGIFVRDFGAHDGCYVLDGILEAVSERGLLQ